MVQSYAGFSQFCSRRSSSCFLSRYFRDSGPSLTGGYTPRVYAAGEVVGADSQRTRRYSWKELQQKWPSRRNLIRGASGSVCCFKKYSRNYSLKRRTKNEAADHRLSPVWAAVRRLTAWLVSGGGTEPRSCLEWDRTEHHCERREEEPSGVNILLCLCAGCGVRCRQCD